MALIDFDQAVRQLCIETGNPDFRNYDTILSYAVLAVQELHLHAGMPALKTKEITPNGIKAIGWPADCIKPLAVGLHRNGKTCNLSMDRSLHDGDCGCSSVSEAEADIEAVLNSPDTSFLGLGDYRGYGKGYDKLGLVKHDKVKRVSYITSRLQKKDVIKFSYMSSGIDEGVESVPSEAMIAIREFVFWNFYRVKSPTISDRARNMYEREFIKLSRFNNDTDSIEDWIDAIRR